MFSAHRQANLAAASQALTDHRDCVAFIASDGTVFELDKTVYATQDDHLMIMIRPLAAIACSEPDDLPTVDPEFYM